MPPTKTLKTDILDYLKKSKKAVSLSELYKSFSGNTKNGIRASIYKLVGEGFVEKVSKERPVTYRAK